MLRTIGSYWRTKQAVRSELREGPGGAEPHASSLMCTCVLCTCPGTAQRRAHFSGVPTSCTQPVHTSAQRRSGRLRPACMPRGYRYVNEACSTYRSANA